MIQLLPLEIRARERIYRQLARKGIVALYEVRNSRHILIGFELIIIRYQASHSRGSWTYEEREKYPNDEQFGRYAWSLPLASRDAAELAFDHLATTMAIKRSIPRSNKDFYPGLGRDSTLQFRSLLAQLLTGRPLGKSRVRSNDTPTPTETTGTKS